MKKPPLRRAAWLRPIARDHGVSLLCAHFAWKAIRAPHTERLIFAAQIRVLCQNSILEYLEDEQWILTPLIGDAGLRQELHRRHNLLRLLIEELNKITLATDPGLGLLASLADGLDGFVRWEQHELFPRIEEGLEKDQVPRLTQMTSKMEKNRQRPTQVRQRQIRRFNMAYRDRISSLQDNFDDEGADSRGTNAASRAAGIISVTANIYAFDEDFRGRRGKPVSDDSDY